MDAGRQAARRSEGDVLPVESIHRVPDPRCREVDPLTQQSRAQLPSAAQRTGNLPLRNAQTSYTPAGVCVSPQDAYAMQLAPAGVTPRDADGHPRFQWQLDREPRERVCGAGLRRPGGFEADQSAMQRGAQWNKPLYKPESWEKVRSLDYGKVEGDPDMAVTSRLASRARMFPGASCRRTSRSGCSTASRTVRVLPLDDRKRDENDYQFSTFNGMGLAHWEGDTLGVESVGSTA